MGGGRVTPKKEGVALEERVEQPELGAALDGDGAAGGRVDEEAVKHRSDCLRARHGEERPGDLIWLAVVNITADRAPFAIMDRAAVKRPAGAVACGMRELPIEAGRVPVRMQRIG